MINSEKQKLLFSNMLRSPDVFSKCQGILVGSYFDPDLAKAVTFSKNYYDDYHIVPTVETIKAETGFVVNGDGFLREDEKQYTIDEVEKYCKYKALETAILASVEFVKLGDGGKVQSLIDEALQVGLHRNLGLRYFEDVEGRLQRMMDSPPVISTGWKDVDDALFGGYSRKELLLVSANSGGGKSITLSNLGFNAIQRGYNVLYISLELAEEIVAQRYDTMYTGVSRKIWKDHTNEIVAGVQRISDDPNYGILDIVQMTSGTTANDIRAYLKEFVSFYKMMPDVLILDYIDKMGPNQKMNISDVWNKDKLCSEQLRDIGVDHNLAVLTASQLNREAIKTDDHNHSHIAGGISKINECDIYWSIILDEIKKAEGICEFKFQKTRNSDGVGRRIVLKWENKYLRILDPDDNSRLFFTKDKKDGLTKFENLPEENTSELSSLGFIDEVENKFKT